ncbi:MAG: METTL5 family protein [Candidatus Poseidoniia archaeon]|nr:METTL5 family protein [Candidatus Poseidoniia archaeon]
MTRFPRARLDRLLRSVPGFPDPQRELEQYPTPPGIALELLERAWQAGDLAGSVADLGCGTGRLALGAAFLGANAVGVELDEAPLEVARQAATGAKLDVEWRCEPVENWAQSVDTVIMNPPWGAQRPGADRPFLERALATAGSVWSIQPATTDRFTRRFVAQQGGSVSGAWPVPLELERTMPHHTRERETVEGILYHLHPVGAR